MIARQLINNEIIPLKTSDTARQALNWMEELKVAHLPIVNNEQLLGLISEQDIYQWNNLDEVVGNHPLSLLKASVYEYQHIYDVMKLIALPGLTLIPVVDVKESYLGSITLLNLLQHLSLTFSVENPGGVIILEISENDYNLTEIANIIESNNAKILSTFIMNHTDSTRLELCLKVNKLEIGNILQTFERYGYLVKATFGNDEREEDLKGNYDSLMNFLNI
ncbi:MAG TPA: CBS domain-containing protein [Bacteroidales bacterium]